MTAAGELITVEDVARLLPVSVSTLYTWRLRGYGPRSFRLGGRVVYDQAEVEQWIASQQHATGRGGAVAALAEPRDGAA